MKLQKIYDFSKDNAYINNTNHYMPNKIIKYLYNEEILKINLENKNENIIKIIRESDNCELIKIDLTNSKKIYDNLIYTIPYSNDILLILNNSTNDVYYVNLQDMNYSTYKSKIFLTNIDKDSIVYGKYFAILQDNISLLYKWENLLKLNEDIVPVFVTDNLSHKIDNYRYYTINWEGSTIVRIKTENYKDYDSTYEYFIPFSNGDNELEFMDDNLNILFTKKIKDIINYNNLSLREKYKINIDRKIKSLFSIKENCLVYYEYCDVVTDRKFNPLEHGYERKYCFDFSNNKHITFKNKKPYYFVTDIFATKIKDDIVLVSNEYFPAGSWIKYYKSYGNIDCNSDNSSDSHDD